MEKNANKIDVIHEDASEEVHDGNVDEEGAWHGTCVYCTVSMNVWSSKKRGIYVCVFLKNVRCIYSRIYIKNVHVYISQEYSRVCFSSIYMCVFLQNIHVHISQEYSGSCFSRIYMCNM